MVLINGSIVQWEARQASFPTETVVPVPAEHQ